MVKVELEGGMGSIEKESACRWYVVSDGLEYIEYDTGYYGGHEVTLTHQKAKVGSEASRQESV